MKAAGRDALLRLCSHAYPRAVRERDGDAIVDLAQELVEAGSSPLREAAGLVSGGASVRVRASATGVASAPWHEARARLALPLAAALFALVAAWAGRSGVASAWVGWSVVVTFAAAAVTLAGAAAGHRWLTAAGAFAMTGMLGLDALRDQYGRGSRFNSEVGSALIDVLVMWIPAGILMLICAGAVRRVAPEVGIQRLAWAVIPGAVLLVVASEPTRVVVVDRIVLFGGFIAAAALVALAITRRLSDSVLPLVAALMVAVVAGPALWLLASFLPPPSSAAPASALGFFGAGGLVAAASILLLARLAHKPASGTSP
jgi:primosomal replication protein N